MRIKRFDRITQSTEFMSMEEAIGHLRCYWEEESIEPLLMEGRTLWTIYSTYMKAEQWGNLDFPFNLIQFRGEETQGWVDSTLCYGVVLGVENYLKNNLEITEKGFILHLD